MPSFWHKRSTPDYDFRRLVDSHTLEPVRSDAPVTHIVCDIDKTYLETRFESVMQIARIAFEDAAEKVTVRGASEVLLAARWDGVTLPRPLHFVSSSPPQLRTVLEEKLALDGLDWSSDTFKNQAYNLRKGRMDQLKQHVAYKSAAILNLIKRAGKGSRFILIGDNAESDTVIYLGIKLLLAKRLTPRAYRRYLGIAGVQDAIAGDFEALIAELPEATVAGILIRNAPGYPSLEVPPLTDCIHRFNHFFEAGLLLVALDVIDVSSIWPLARTFHNRYGLSRGELVADLKALAVWFRDKTALVEATAEAIVKIQAAGPIKADGTVRSVLAECDLADHQALDEDGILHFLGEWILRMGKRPAPT